MSKINSVSFWVHLTNSCNLNCQYCYISTLKHDVHMTHEVLEQLKIKLIELAVLHPELDTIGLKLAGGEPLSTFPLWKAQLQEIIDSFHNLKTHLKVKIISNLTILNTEIVRFAKENNIFFAVSLDGVEEYHDVNRNYSGHGSYKTIKKNLSILSSNEIPYAVLVTITNENMDGVVNLTKKLLEENIPFRLADAKGIDVEQKKLYAVLESCYQLMKKYTKYDFHKYVLCDLDFERTVSIPCSMGMSGGAIFTTGEVYFCHSQFGECSPIGSIFDSVDLLKTIEKGYHFHSISKECSLCEFKFICAGGCPLYRSKYNKSPICHIYKKLIPEHMKLIDGYAND